MRVLVTGGAGFIGSALCKGLSDAGHSVTVFDNLVCGRQAPEGVEFVHGDVSCWEDFIQIQKASFDVVYHLAASFANEKSIGNHLLDAKSNIIGTINVCRYAETCGVGRVIYTGSSSSYGGCESSLPFHEDGPVKPSTPYALSKHVGEFYIQNSGLPYTIVRLFNVFGPGDIPGTYRNAIPNMIRDALLKGTVFVTGGQATRDFTYIHKLVPFLVDCMESKPRDSVVVNACSGVERPMVYVAKLLASELGAEVMVQPPREWDSVIRRVGNTDRLLRLWPNARSWSEDFETQIADTISWVKLYLRSPYV